tara:strand:- start:11621 stop:13405 length:1785 start_codon:yes stop_codon:yes gene_type:complete
MNISYEINSALNEFASGKKDAAYKKLKKLLNKNENDLRLRFNLAVIEQSLNLNTEAKKNYIFLINKNYGYKAMINLYLLYIKEADYFNALIIIDKLISIRDNINSVYKDKAFVLYKLKKFDESINICKHHLKEDIDISYINILGLNLLSKNNYSESEKVLKKGLEIDGENTSILNSLGRLYHEKRDSKKAERYLLKAYHLNNDSYEVINNLAGFYREEGMYDQSIELYLKAMEMNPQNPTIMNNLAKAYFNISKFEIAEEYCLKALKLNKNDGNIQKILSLIYLRQQKYKAGWNYFDGRLNLSDFIERNSSIKNIRKKLISKNYLNKKLKVLILREQGIGDEILYGTMYKDILNRCENVTIECDPRLKNIFCNSFPTYKNSFVNSGEISLNKNLINNYEIAIYAGSLGKFFRNKIEDFSDGNYLFPYKKMIKETKNKLMKYSGELNIGISWKSFKNRYAGEKSLVLENFNNIFDTKNCNFINLQYGEINNEVANYNNRFNKNIITLENLDLMNDFDKLASVLVNLDLFISVSNSTAHLAGSLGVNTLLIRPDNHAIFHYWNQPGKQTPWYKTITFLDKDEIKSEKNLINKYLNI